MPRRRIRPLFGAPLALAAALGIAPSGARAGNDDGILIGGHAALTAGAVTATVGDGSAAWYNPAGIARASRQTFDLNASAYGVSLIAADNLFTLPDGTRAGASVVDWQLIPSALSYTRQLSERWVGAFSVVIPSTTDADLRAAVTGSDDTRWQFGVDAFRNEYDYLLSLGARLTDRIRVGVSLGGVYIASEEMIQIGAGRPGEPGTSFLLASSHRTTGDYGARLIFGLQWSVSAQLELGLSAQLPALTAFRKVDATLVQGALPEDPSLSIFEATSEHKLHGAWEFSTPLVLRAGLAYTLGRVQLALDGSALSALHTSEESLDRKWTGNVRLGALVRLSDELSVGAGAFTDLNGMRELNADFAGVTGGVRLSRNYHVLEGGRPLTFFTTLAGRYAYGWGHVAGVAFTSEDDVVDRRARIQVHELALNLGGGVSY